MSLRDLVYFAVILVILTGCGFHRFQPGLEDDQRGAVASAIVGEQFQSLKFEGARRNERVNWSRAAQSDDPHFILDWVSARVTASTGGRPLVKNLTETCKREKCSESLREALWSLSRTVSNHKESVRSVESLLVAGEAEYFSAAGYYRMHQELDAGFHFLLAIAHLTRFVQVAPAHPRTAHALYMLGVSYFHLRRHLPDSLRSDRILKLVSELYPDSIWSARADALWRLRRLPDA